MNKSIIISTPDLRPSHMSILKGLDDEGLLDKLITTLFFIPNSPFYKILRAFSDKFPSKLNKGIDKRVLPEFLINKTYHYRFGEILRILASKTNNKVLTHQVWKWSSRRFDKYVAKNFSGKAQYLYGMEYSSLNSFKAQKSYGGLCILRQVIAHPKEVARIIKKESEQNSNYSNSYTSLILNEMDETINHKEKEYDLADLIIANSYYVKESFINNGIEPEKIVAVPTGCPSPMITKISNKNKKLIFLYAGSMSYRKGINYLIDVWKKNDFYKFSELWLAGQNEILNLNELSEIKSFKYLGNLSSTQLEKVYEVADVFILPSLIEGRSHAVLEALSFGLPIITTEESGCIDLIEHKQNGYIINPADSNEIKKSLNWFLDNKQNLDEMGNLSLAKARSWTVQDSNIAHIELIKKCFNL